MTLARMMMRNPRIRIRSPAAIGTAICHDGMGGTGGRFEMHFYTVKQEGTNSGRLWGQHVLM